jgi:hypothetical protein
MPERSTFNEVGRFMTVASTEGRLATRQNRLCLSYASLDSRFQSEHFAFTAQARHSGARSFRMSRWLQLAPILGLLCFPFAMMAWRPLDDAPFYWIGLILFFLSVLVMSYVQRQAKKGVDVNSFFPFTNWLAFGCALVALVVVINAKLDHSAVEQHQQMVTRKFVSRGRSASNNIEFSSWRNRPFERISVSRQIYDQFQVDQPIIVDLHRGALGIPWIGAIHKVRGQ